jgi:DNA-binding response OmpR family regulator
MGGKGEPYFLVLGQLRAEDRASVAAAAQRMDAELKTTISAKAALEAVQTRPPLLLLVETAAAGADALCGAVRSNDRVRSTPIIGMPRELNDRAFSRAFDWGVDDLVELGDWEALDRRLPSIRLLQGSHRTVDLGEAVVADHDQTRCAVLGRVLSSAGYKVRHALDPRSLQYHSRNTAVRLIVANPSVGDVWNVLNESRSGNPGPAWVITVPPDEVEHWANRIGELERVGVTNALGPPENIVFFSNGLLSKRSTEARASARNLYGTAVAFRPVGASKDDYGFTYNVSRNGVYVRSLLSLANDDIWIDVRPPRTDRYVRLLGRIAWRKALGATAGHGTPPGFAIEIVDGLARDMELWARGCEAIEAGSRRKPISLKPGVIGLGPLETSSDETSISSRPPHDSERPSSVSLKLPMTDDAQGSDPAPSSGPTETSVADSRPTPGDTVEGSTEHSSASLLRTRNAPSLLVTLLLCSVVAVLVIAPALIWALGEMQQPPIVRSAPRKASRAALLTTNSIPAASASAAQPAPAPSVPPEPSAAQPTPTLSPLGSSAAPSASVAPLSTPPAPAASALVAPNIGSSLTTVDLDLLPADHGFLRVLSPAKARVLVQGQDVGETNAWRIVKCGRRTVRLADSDGAFLDPGSTVFVQCHGATTVQIAPKRPVDTGSKAR